MANLLKVRCLAENYSQEHKQIFYKTNEIIEIVFNTEDVSCIREEEYLVDGENRKIVVIHGNKGLSLKVHPDDISFENLDKVFFFNILRENALIRGKSISFNATLDPVIYD